MKTSTVLVMAMFGGVFVAGFLFGLCAAGAWYLRKLRRVGASYRADRDELDRFFKDAGREAL
jgi:hypothetical protein